MVAGAITDVASARLRAIFFANLFPFQRQEVVIVPGRVHVVGPCGEIALVWILIHFVNGLAVEIDPANAMRAKIADDVGNGGTADGARRAIGSQYLHVVKACTVVGRRQHFPRCGAATFRAARDGM